MSNNDVKGMAIGATAVLLIIVASLIGGFTKAQNDQAYLDIVQQGMSTEGFEEFMENKQMHNGNSW